MIELSNIMMATDFTKASKDGRLFARDLCRRFKAKLHLVHIVDDRAASLQDAAARVVESDDHALARHAALEESAIVSLWGELFPDYRKDHEIEFAAVFGHPVVEIPKYARQHSIDLIVAGTHGRTGIEHFLSGSVAEQLVRTAPCPVLTVHSSSAATELDLAAGLRVATGDQGGMQVLPAT